MSEEKLLTGTGGVAVKDAVEMLVRQENRQEFLSSAGFLVNK